ncbi:alpha amanitin sensitivity protein [Cotia virus SPAn232]|uniref:Alpha amanitin sensitivity protein n=2 Tax=Cotia virus TaxID=39444 RepID=H6TAI0_9POXV|nr:alpha amanitin sensitivity protein [Cotia virus SPAn232]AFB76917.1 alpha amanitin sensitivity protein [Cotia virus SPAn232]AIT70642.1 alpha amanitin sensitivity protein [Cotia virus]
MYNMESNNVLYSQVYRPHSYSFNIITILDRFLTMKKDDINNNTCKIIKEFMTYEQLAIDHYGGYINAILYQLRKRPNENNPYIYLFKKNKRTINDTFKVDTIEYIKRVIGFVSILNRYNPVYSYVLYDNVSYSDIKHFIGYIESKHFQHYW